VWIGFGVGDCQRDFAYQELLAANKMHTPRHNQQRISQGCHVENAVVRRISAQLN
jgi:hypothetical protein